MLKTSAELCAVQFRWITLKNRKRNNRNAFSYFDFFCFTDFLHRALPCMVSDGKLYGGDGEKWNPDKLTECTCTNGIISCQTQPGCLDDKNDVKQPGERWLLQDFTTICHCTLNSTKECKNRTYETCFDDKRNIYDGGQKWQLTNCTSCMCSSGNITCTQHDIKAYYGRFVLKTHTCYEDRQPFCKPANETTRDCLGN